MLVHQILSSKPSDAVLTIAEDATIAQAAMILSERRIGCLVVSGTGTRADGIISERDIVREVGRRGSACLSDPVGSIMTRRLVTCTRDETADNVLEIMTNNRFRHLPVVEHGHLIGLISIGDVVKARLNELAHEKEALEGMIKGL